MPFFQSTNPGRSGGGDLRRAVVVGAGFGGAAFGLVGAQDNLRGFAAQNVGENLVRRQNACPRVDHEQTGVGHFDGALGQAPHAALQAFVCRLFQASRVDDRKAQIAKPRRTFPQVARHARLIIDERQLLAHQTVEQGRLAHIGTTNNDDGGFHIHLASAPCERIRQAEGDFFAA